MNNTAVSAVSADDRRDRRHHELQAVRVEIPGKVARHLDDHTELGEAERHALRRRAAQAR